MTDFRYACHFITFSSTSTMKTKEGSGKYCTVLGCTNGSRKLRKWKRAICGIHSPSTHDECACLQPYQMHRFPNGASSDSSAKQKQWLTNINREGFIPNANSRICSAHFTDGRPTSDHPDPVMHMGYNNYSDPANNLIQCQNMEKAEDNLLVSIKKEPKWIDYQFTDGNDTTSGNLDLPDKSMSGDLPCDQSCGWEPEPRHPTSLLSMPGDACLITDEGWIPSEDSEDTSSRIMVTDVIDHPTKEHRGGEMTGIQEHCLNHQASIKGCHDVTTGDHDRNKSASPYALIELNGISTYAVTRRFETDDDVIRHFSTGAMLRLASIPGTIINHVMKAKPVELTRPVDVDRSASVSRAERSLMDT